MGVQEISRRLIDGVWRTGRAEEGNGGSSPVLIDSTDISAAQLLAMHTTPVELLPALTGRNYYVVHGFVLHYRFVTTPYTYTRDDLASGLMTMYGNSLPSYDAAYFLPLSLGSTIADLFKRTEDDYVFMAVGGDRLITYHWGASLIEAMPLNLVIDGAGLPGAQLVGGDGTLTVRLFYSVINGAP